MEKQDARTHNQETQFELRKQVVRFRKKGLDNRSVAAMVGISTTHCSTIWQKYLKGGIEAIKPGVRGRRHGEKRRLTESQEHDVQTMLIDEAPTQLKLPFALWTRDAVHLAIKKKFGVVLPMRTITDYLKRWGFTPQKPVKRAYEQDTKKVQAWLDKEYPAIASKAKKEKAEIHWGDETGIQNTAYNAKGFALKGQPPIIRLSAKKCRINMMSTVTNNGKVRFMLYRENMTSAVLIKFMSRLIQDVHQKVILILDNLKVHHSKLVKAWLEKHKEQIEVFYLPPYSPEHNPDEYLNGDLKNHMHSGLQARTEGDLTKKTRSFMRMLQRRPNRVKNYFQHPLIAYAG